MMTHAKTNRPRIFTNKRMDVVHIREFVTQFGDGFATPLMDGRVVPLSVKTLIFYH